MNIPRLPLLVSSVLLVPMALVVGGAGPAAAAPPSTTFEHGRPPVRRRDRWSRRRARSALPAALSGRR